MKFRKIHSEAIGEDYYLPVDEVNVGDSLFVTDSKPGYMKGYGGGTLNFVMQDDTVENVVGPWHTNSTGFYKHTGINIGELHLTKVTLTDGDKVIYKEVEPVLGQFYRGDRIAQQLAVIRDRPITVHSESDGGSSTKTCYPDGRYNHPLSRRHDDV